VHHQEKEGSMNRLSGPSGQAVYLIALCAAKPEYLPKLDAGLWLFDDAEESVYKHYHHEIQKNMQAGAILESRDAEIDQLKTELAARGNEPDTTRQTPWWRRLLGKS